MIFAPEYASLATSHQEVLNCLIEVFGEDLGTPLLDEGRPSGPVITLTVPASRLLAFVERLGEFDYPHLSSVSCEEREDGVILHYDFSLFRASSPGEGLMICVALSPQEQKGMIPSLSGLSPWAEYAERELTDRLAVEFQGLENRGPLLDRREEPTVPPDYVVLPLAAAGRTESFALAVRLVRGRIGSVRFHLGSLHRDVETLAMGGDSFQALPLAERLCGSCSFANALAYVRALEDASGFDVPRRARYVRSLFQELERLSSHLLWLATAFHGEGQEALLAATLALREPILDVQEKLTGKRSVSAVVAIGGVRVDLSRQGLETLQSMLAVTRRELRPFRDALLRGGLLRCRMEHRGFLPKAEAVRHGAVGPVAKASGLPVDRRSHSPYEAYGELDFLPLILERGSGEAGGDVFDRLLMRVMELSQSLDLIEKIVEGLPEGPLLAVPKRRNLVGALKEADGRGLGAVEGPRGEVIHAVTLHAGQTALSSWSVTSATRRNLSLLPRLLKGALLDDAMAIVNSLDPCLACVECLLPLKAGEELTEGGQRR
ncbi:MAG: nickel-dependent hydrogenase large subunit [Synergistaceae bacterium]|nr:nickel-dependent hydrogenase large subunit [Synergistaceae bacterium]